MKLKVCPCRGCTKAYRAGLAVWASFHTGNGQPDDDSDKRRWCECGQVWPCHDYRMLVRYGWTGEQG
jgi:hypothetical protein